MLLRPFANYVQVRLPHWVLVTPGGAFLLDCLFFPPPCAILWVQTPAKAKYGIRRLPYLYVGLSLSHLILPSVF